MDKNAENNSPSNSAPQLQCGIVMPISAFDSYSEQHWTDVLEIVTESVEMTGYEAGLVSTADHVGIIQKQIVKNLFENPIIVCDVSGKNANVMFELGMRLAFDKPTIIIKDDVTSYSFDTSPIEHLTYPRDLRYTQMVEFKSLLAKKITGTLKQASEDSSYTTFLGHFGTMYVPKIDTREVSKDEYILSELAEIRNLLARQSAPSGWSDLATRDYLSSMAHQTLRQAVHRCHSKIFDDARAGDSISDATCNSIMAVWVKLLSDNKKLNAYFKSSRELSLFLDEFVNKSEVHSVANAFVAELRENGFTT